MSTNPTARWAPGRRKHGRPWPTTLLLPLAVVLVLACGAPEPSDESIPAATVDAPQRVVLVTIDTLRVDHLGSSGYPRNTSPFLDSLANSGTMFERAYSSCSHTGPSHATLFTGLEPPQHRLLQNGETLHDDVLTLAEVFRDTGYRTAAFSTVGFLQGLSQGFDNFDTRGQYHPASDVLGRAGAWIADQPEDARLFVWIHLFDVHEWYQRDHVDPAGLEHIAAEPLQGEELATFLEAEHGVRYGHFERAKIVDSVDRYDGQLWVTDQTLARFHGDLGSAFNEDALWLITADHGEGLGNHDFLGHGKNIYDEQLRVPLILVGPGITAGLRIDQPVGLVDLAPTLAERVGASFDEQRFPIAGRSLGPLLAGETLPPKPLYAQRRPVDEKRLREGWAEGEVFALIDGSHKVIANTHGQHELYDLSVDPFELDDRFATADPAEAALRDTLLRQAAQRFRDMMRQGEAVAGEGIDASHVEELRALGYL